MSNGKLTINKPQPDYGLKVTTSRRAHIPEIRYVGTLDITYETGRVQVPKEGDESTMVNVKSTHYEVEIGKTRFSGIFDVSTFGQCYVEGSATRSGDTFGFTRYSTLEEYRAAKGGKLSGTVSCKGTHESTRIDNYKSVSNDSWTDLLDIYDGMTFIAGSTVTNNVSSAGYLKCGKVSYKGWSATFSYREGSFVCRLSGGEAPSGYIQAVYMGHTK